MKKSIFSKVKLVNYNNTLESILEKKDFSEEVKNLLLSMLYKIEDAYNDYETVKVNVEEKSDFIEQIIDIIKNSCNEINIIKSSSDEEKKYNIDKENGIINTYQNEQIILEAIFNIQNRDIINENEQIYNKALENLLKIGDIVDKTEVIKDFDGWSWNIQDKKEDAYYHLIYQNLLMLLENSLINMQNDEESVEEEYIPNNEILRSKYLSKDIKEEQHTDFFIKLRQRLLEEDDEKLVGEFENQLKKTLLVMISNSCEDEKEKIEKIRLDNEQKLQEMKDKKRFIDNVSQKKQELNEELKYIEDLLNNEKLLREEYEKTNKKLSNKEKIFSVSQFAKQLIKKKSINLEKIKKMNMLINPKEFIKIKNDLEKKSKFFEEWNSENKKIDETKQIIILQKIFLDCIEQRIEKKEKNELCTYMYEIRYYRAIIEKIEELKKSTLIKKLDNIEKAIIKKACEEKVLTLFSEDEKLNFDILKNIFESKIIELENIIMKLKYDKDILSVAILDGDIIDEVKEIKITQKTDLSVKLNKKIKLFI